MEGIVRQRKVTPLPPWAFTNWSSRPIPKVLQARANHLATQVVDAAYHIHKALGPGLLESVYEVTLAQELQQKRHIPTKRQHPIKIKYQGLTFTEAYKADLLVDNTLIVEIKSVEAIAAVHRMQLLSYLRLANLPLGILINFNVALIKDGLKRVVNKQSVSA